ncbi:MAG: prolyl oligopeptidase family serine peptidase [Caulobacter sp.]|nr:prolyl oligopeptidase family serine peptidase [Caulobacter sp.]
MVRGVLTALVCALFLTSPALAAPVEAYGRLPAIEDVTISDDGKTLAYIRNDGDARQLLVQTREGDVLGGADLTGVKVRSLMWGSPDHVIVMATTTADLSDFFYKSEIPLAYSYNVKTGKIVRLMNRSSREAINAIFSTPQIADYKGRPTAYAMGYTVENEARRYDVYRIDLDTGYGALYQRGPDDFARFLIDADGGMAAMTTETSAGRWRLQTRAGGAWIDAASTPRSIDSPGMAGFGRSLDTVLIQLLDEDAGHWTLREVNRTTGALGEPFGPELPTDTLLHGRDGRLVALGYTDVFTDYEIYEPQLAETWKLVKTSFANMRVTLQSMTPDYKTVVIRVEGSGEPGAWYVVDAAAKRAQRVGSEYPGVAGADVADVRVFRYKAKDGLDMFGYLTLPAGKDPRNLPLVLLPHGGPAARDVAGFDWWAQALASRGYAVFQPNFRGSDGLGESFLRAGYGEYGRKMQTDLSDGVRALATAGVIDPTRVCIVGASYGGYAALAGMTLDQGVYRCAVSVAGVSDLPRKQDRATTRTGGSDSTTVRYWNRFLGVSSANDPVLKTLSPAYLADRVNGPILLIHGRDDTVVPYEQSVVMNKALVSAGKSVEFVTLDGEDHYMSATKTRQQMLQATLTFLEKYNPPK